MGGTGGNQTDNPTASRRWQSYPYNFLFSGNWYSGSVYNRGSNGNYWSRTARSAANAYRLYFGTSGVNPGTRNDYKYRGFTVRCVAGS